MTGLRSTVAVLLCLAGAPALAGVPISADFDYEVRERFAVPPLGDGLGATAGEIYSDPQPAAGAEPAFVHPSAWTVDFDACTSTGPIVEYRWTIDSIPAGSSAQCDGFSFDFTTLGTHDVSLTVVDAAMLEVTHADAIEVVDFLIVSLGDSFASGEGVPDAPIAQLDIDAAELAQSAVEDAQTAADSATAALVQATADLADVLSDVADVVALQQTYLLTFAADAACGSVPECIATGAALASATAAFVQGLLDVGLGAVDFADATAVTNALNGLVASATSVQADAQLASDAAQLALAAAQTDLDAALLALEPVWRNRRCHRSANSAHVLAAQQLAESDPYSAVTFIHLPCSGATIETGVIGQYDGIDPVELNESTGMLEPPSVQLPAQLDRARFLVCGASCDASDRSVDAWLVSVGGNDVNFADIIETCIAGEPCFDDPVPDATTASAISLVCGLIGPFTSVCDDFFGALTTFDAEDAFLNGLGEPPPNGLDDLPTHYQSLATALTNTFGQAANPQLLLIEYPDVTRDESGSHCGWEITQSPGEQLENVPGVSPAEMMWADSVVQAQLAAAMQNAATLHGWQFVGGVSSAFDTHGYCASDNWIQRIQDSFIAQGSVEGAVHPTLSGQSAIRDAVLAQLPEPGGALLGAACLSTLASVARVRRLRLRSRGTGAPPSRP